MKKEKPNMDSSFICKLQDTISTIHLYPTAQETLIKMLALLISWIISIFCYYNSVGAAEADSNSVVLFGGSVVLFCISILLEVFDRIDTSASFFKMLLTMIIVFSTIGCLALGLVIIFVKAVNIDPNLLIMLCVIPICVYVFDSITYFLVRSPSSSNQRGQESILKDIHV